MRIICSREQEYSLVTESGCTATWNSSKKTFKSGQNSKVQDVRLTKGADLIVCHKNQDSGIIAFRG